MPQPALFLDRDGIINVDRGYVFRRDQFEFQPGIFDLARYAVNELRWPIIVVTNQSGIGRGYFDEAEFQILTRWMCDVFATERAPITKVYHCSYHPEFGLGRYRREHSWRKPKPGMLLQAAADLDLDLSRSVMIGDAPSDVEAGASAGIGLRILVAKTDAVKTPSQHHRTQDLVEALAVLRKTFGPSHNSR